MGAWREEVEAPGGQTTWERGILFIPQSHVAVVPPPGARMTEPGLGWDLGALQSWGGTGHNLPSRYLRGNTTGTDDVWACPS